jgi:hypothetical protein
MHSSQQRLCRSADQAFSELVEKFCFATGGGTGAYFGTDNCFALGVAAWPRSTSLSSRAFQTTGPTAPLSIYVPPGFAVGREVIPPPIATKGDDFFEYIAPSQEKAEVAFGRISWDRKDEPADFVRVPLNICPADPDGAVKDFGQLPDLIRFFCERVWGLKRPRLLISVTGSSEDCDLRMEDRKALLSVRPFPCPLRIALPLTGSTLSGGLRKCALFLHLRACRAS